MPLSLKATVDFADDHLAENGRLVLAVGHMVPAEYVQTYRRVLAKNNRVPAKTNRLRRSVRYQALGNVGTIRWLAPYAAAQEAGKAEVPGQKIRIFRKYTKPGTGRGFAQEAYHDTNRVFMADFAARHPELGLQ